MADVLSVQLDDTGATPLRRYPIDLHGKLRIAVGEYTSPEELAAGTTIGMLRLPAGRLRILGRMSQYSVSALGASRVLNVGHEAYQTGDNTTEAEDLDDFVAADDVSSAVSNEPLSTTPFIDVYSKSGILITFQVTGGVIDAGETFQLIVFYVQD